MIKTRLVSLSIFLLSLPFVLGAQESGYKLTLKVDQPPDSLVYLVHYFGKPLPTIYRVDSAYFDEQGKAVLSRDSVVTGGIYMFLFGDRKTYFEFLLNDGDEMEITVPVNDLPYGLKFRYSAENQRFIEYLKYMESYAKKHEAIMKGLESAATAEDTAAVMDQRTALTSSLHTYRKEYMSKYPGTLLASIFGALQMPQVPEGPHWDEQGNPDSSFAYRYYKEHFWDGFNFRDDRLIYTPIYDGKLEEYFNKLVLPVEDSVIKEADMLLQKTRGSKDLFRYTLWYITRFAESSNVMGMDAVFVDLVENYYMKGDAYWLDAETLQKYIDRAQDIAPNMIGNLAPALVMPDIHGKMQSLHDIQARYTVLLFWSPDCGHCLKEVPVLDSLYHHYLKGVDARIFAVRTDAYERWKPEIEKASVEDWIHVHDPERQTRFRQDYDIYSTPVIYLLDEKKIIRGKRLDPENLGKLVEQLEKKRKSSP